MKKLLETAGILAYRYTCLDEYKQVLYSDIAVKPLKKKKHFTFLNPANLQVVVSPNDALLPIVGGGLRPLLQEFEIA